MVLIQDPTAEPTTFDEAVTYLEAIYHLEASQLDTPRNTRPSNMVGNVTTKSREIRESNGG